MGAFKNMLSASYVNGYGQRIVMWQKQIRSKHLLFLLEKAYDMPICAEKAKLYIEIAIKLRHRNYLRRNPNYTGAFYFEGAASIYKKLHMNAEAKGAFLAACREFIRFGWVGELREIREKHKKGLI